MPHPAKIYGPPRPEAIVTFLATDSHLPGAQTLLHSLRKHCPTLGAAAASGTSGSGGGKSSKLVRRGQSRAYPPETVVLVTSDVTREVREALLSCPEFCTRILEVEFVAMPAACAGGGDGSGSGDSVGKQKEAQNEADGSGKEGGKEEGGGSHVSAWDRHCGLTKLSIFTLEQYSTLLYIDADCLVVQDVTHLFRIGRREVEKDEMSDDGGRRGLLAAAPDIFPPDRFNAGVMLLRPCAQTYRSILTQANTGELTSYDGGDTGLLNAYYSNWFTSMHPSSRLGFGYNAQRFMYNCTFGKRPQYWEEGVCGVGSGKGGKEDSELYIIHYSSSPKPWEDMERKSKNGAGGSESAKALLDSTSADAVAKTSPTSELDELWQRYFNDALEYCYENDMRNAVNRKKRKAKEEKERHQQEEEEARRREQRELEELARRRAADEAHPQKRSNVIPVHNNVSKRYKELRKEGLGTAEAMKQARKDCGMDRNDELDPRAAVGKMFGMG